MPPEPRAIVVNTYRHASEAPNEPQAGWRTRSGSRSAPSWFVFACIGMYIHVSVRIMSCIVVCTVVCFWYVLWYAHPEVAGCKGMYHHIFAKYGHLYNTIHTEYIHEYIPIPPYGLTGIHVVVLVCIMKCLL